MNATIGLILSASSEDEKLTSVQNCDSLDCGIDSELVLCVTLPTMKPAFPILSVLTFALLFGPILLGAETVKIFILTGQSNMEGKAKVSLMDYQAQQTEYEELYSDLRTSEGEWVVRDDVWIKFLDRKGPLTVGFGSKDRVGPELNFGRVVGDAIDEPVLLIKPAWGGKSLFRDFRSPSSGLPAAEVLANDLEKAQRKRPETTQKDIEESYGHFYRLMLEEVRMAMEDPGALFPELADHKPEIAGLVWFQGWNDMVNADYVAAYSENMAHFIRDVRKDLKVPEMPVVIGQLGVGGTDPAKPNEKRDEFKKNQAAPASLPEFKGNVAVVETDQYWDVKADAVFSKGWKQNIEEWEKVGSDYPFHYLGSPTTYLGIGEGFGEAILKLMDQ